MPFALLVVIRLGVAALSLLTCAYALLNCSPFAFDMFIRPQLFPWLTTFVAWHHIWWAAAFTASLATIAPELRFPSAQRPAPSAGRAAHFLALGYAIVFGIIAVAMMTSPPLPKVWGMQRALAAAVLTLAPMFWLGVIDHVVARARRSETPGQASSVTGITRLSIACAATAAYIWISHVVWMVPGGRIGRWDLAWFLSAAWSLALVATVFSAVLALLWLCAGLAARTRDPQSTELALTVVLLAGAICEFLRRVVFPTVSLGAVESLVAAAAGGVAIAMMWSGLAVRRPACATAAPAEILIAPAGAVWTTKTGAAVALVALSLLTFVTLESSSRLDWDFVGQRTIVVLECLLAFGVMLRVTARIREAGRWPVLTAVAFPMLAIVGLRGVPVAAASLASLTGDRELQPAVALERQVAGHVAFRLMADALVHRPGFDGEYRRFLQVHDDISGRTAPAIPDIQFVADRRPAATDQRPDIFLFVIDSLRRDYLSPYNAAVTFTPAIQALANDGFVFENAFTRHGGTGLAMPSIWAGAPIVGKALGQGFHRMNAIEKLLNAEDYRVAINDFTVAGHLLPTTPVTTIDPGVASVETDLCQNLSSLERHIELTARDSRPLFGFFAPMNVHILNTRRGGATNGDTSAGFYAPYARSLRRIDACLGRFVQYLKARGRYDRSVIVLTSDHGDSLGEDGRWGHATWLFPEDVRVPLIVRIPPSVKADVTTDLARVAFSSDIAPTLYQLLGREFRRPGPLFGEPLFVAPNERLSSRRRDAFLLTSTYGPSYALVRRNGRYLYVSDLVEWRELAYDLSHEPIGAAMVIDPALRRVNQRRIREQMSEIAALYGLSDPADGSPDGRPLEAWRRP